MGSNGVQEGTSTGNQLPTQVPIDLTSVFYVHPSESAGSTIVSVLFDGSGYRSWRRAVLRGLSVKNKTGFINGKVLKPPLDSPGFSQWERCDDMVTSWILNSLSKDLRDSLQYVDNAKELWDELEDRYDQPNGAKLYQLQRELNDLSQGNLDITGYYTRIKKLWEELSTLDTNSQCTCLCTCGGKSKMHKAELDRRLIQFLMGLNEVYTIVRGSILMMNPLPTMAQAFSILVQEERQREVKPHNKPHMDSSSFHVNAASTSSGFRTNYTPHKNNVGTSRPSSKSNLFCDYCKKTGHIREKCYRLHGFPPDFKFTKGRNAGTAANANGFSEDMLGDIFEKGHDVGKGKGKLHEQSNSMLTKQQFNQLVNLLDHIQVQGGTNTSSTAHEDASNFNGGAVNFAGPFTEEPSGDW
ncbi:uncharacterized protein [Solanum tuberosum]|uniref:uncharacterized protein n=1 Tax=Solanum tuberosum TaxID=4113 RepID=UPI00073A4328|nr:PREDICTED: uncharacterized protein LOC107063248 [Solanum tuberosum]